MRNMNRYTGVVVNRVQWMIYAKPQPVITNELRLKVVQRAIHIMREMTDG